MLIEETLSTSTVPLSDEAIALIARGRSLAKTVSCFDFVPSDYELAWTVLSTLPRGRFCEWGSGLGVVTGLANILGFHAHGIEIDAQLAETSRQLLAEFHLDATIQCGDYLTTEREADVYFVYCWPGKVIETETHFETIAPQSARLLICQGQSDIRCKLREQGRTLVLQRHKDLVRQFFHQVVNQTEDQALSDFISADHLNHDCAEPGGRGIERVRQLITALRSDWEGLHATVEDQVAEGDMVASRVAYRGTPRSSRLSLPPTGTPVTLRGVQMVRIREEMIVESWNLFGPGGLADNG